MQAHETLRLALPEVQYYKAWVSDRVPKAEFTTVDSPREFFESSGAEFDALVYPAESGAAWSLIYPSYTAVVPEQFVTKIPLAYAVQLRNSHMLRLVNTWLELKQRDGTIQRAFDYWILGRGATPDVPRWSVVRNLLGWVD